MRYKLNWKDWLPIVGLVRSFGEVQVDDPTATKYAIWQTFWIGAAVAGLFVLIELVVKNAEAIDSCLIF